MAKKGDLTDKQRRFVEEHLIDGNATQAAIRAGFSQKTAAAAGARLLRNVKVAAALAAAQQARSERTQITADLVLQGLLTEARYRGEGTSHSARVAAWDKLARHLGMYRDALDVTSGQKPIEQSRSLMATVQRYAKVICALRAGIIPKDLPEELDHEVDRLAEFRRRYAAANENSQADE
jgi:phage terminase small subunit